MNRNFVRAVMLWLGVLVFAVPLAARECRLWFEDSNLGRKAYFPDDAREKFLRPETWRKSRAVMDGYMIRINVFHKKNNRLDPYFIKYKMLKLLKKDRVGLVLDVLGGTMTHINRRKERIARREFRTIEMIEGMGMKIDAIAFQSALSKSPRKIRRKRGAFADGYPMEQRIRDLCDYAERVHAKFPHIRFGIIDALPTKNLPYKEPYLALKKAMEARGLTLDFIMLDMSYHVLETGWRGMSWEKLKEVERYVHDTLHLRFGKTFDDRVGGNRSDRDYYLRVTKMVKKFRDKGIEADICAFMSWFPYPERTIPESEPYTMTYDFLKVAELLNGRSAPAGEGE